MKKSLENMSLLDALSLARMQSGKSIEDVAAEMGWTMSNANRIFASDNYWPTLPNIPKLCEKLGNTILIDWLLVQAEQGGLEKEFGEFDWVELLEALNQFSADVGALHEEAAEVVKDREIDSHEARRMRRKIRLVLIRGVSMLNGLNISK